MTNEQIQRDVLVTVLGALYLRMLRANGDKEDQLHAEISGYNTALRAGFGVPFAAEVFKEAQAWAETEAQMTAKVDV